MTDENEPHPRAVLSSAQLGVAVPKRTEVGAFYLVPCLHLATPFWGATWVIGSSIGGA